MKASASRMKALPASADVPAADPAPLGARIGRIVELAEGGVPRIDFAGNPHGPLVARLALSAADAQRLSQRWHDVDLLVVFAGQDIRHPLIAGVVRDSLDECRRHVEEWQGFDQLLLRAREELSLQCGDARLVLARDGAVTIVGKEILARAKGRHRIRGGTVEIN